MRISFHEAPAASRLFLDYLDNWPRLSNFYQHNYSIESIAAFARERPRPDRSQLDRLCSALTEQQKTWGASTRGVEKLNAGAAAVVTGQQSGLFTGPILAVYKAISAIKLARTLEESGIPAVPVFWMAAEDHDHEEIKWASVLSRDTTLYRVEVDLEGDETAPVGWTEYPDEVRAAVSQCLENLPQSEFTLEVRELLNTSYRPGLSPVEAFARMMSQLFKDSDLIFVNPLDRELKDLARPALAAAVGANSKIRAALLNRSSLLLAAGYHAQVKVDGNFTGLFAYTGKSRQVLKPGEVSSDAVLSPNALLRPVVQDTIFPTAAYVGGPAEIAYFAQAAAVYDALDQPMPPIFPRISATLIEPRVNRALRKYEMQFTDVFRGRDFLNRKAVEAIQDTTAFDRALSGVAAAMEPLGALFGPVDSTLVGALGTAQRKMLYQVEALRVRFLNAQARRNAEMNRQLDAIVNSLFPDKKFQERVINVTSFISRYGPGLIGRLERQLSIDTAEHQLVEIE